MQQALFWEEMARVDAPPMANALGLGLIGPTIVACGTEAQKKRYIPKILSAEEIWCQGFSEPNAGSDLAGLQNGSTAGRRSLHRERSKGVDQLWHPGRLVRTRGPHRRQRSPSTEDSPFS